MKNGIRQPHCANAGGGINQVTSVAVAVASRIAAPIDTICADDAKARLCVGACSTRYTAEPWNSPPVEKPCTIRATSSMIGATMPTSAKGGVTATRSEEHTSELQSLRHL